MDQLSRQRAGALLVAVHEPGLGGDRLPFHIAEIIQPLPEGVEAAEGRFGLGREIADHRDLPGWRRIRGGRREIGREAERTSHERDGDAERQGDDDREPDPPHWRTSVGMAGGSLAEDGWSHEPDALFER